MKLCVDCRFYGVNASKPISHGGQPVIRQPGSALLCLHSSTSQGISLTTGEPIRSATTARAAYQRSIPHLIAIWTGACGNRGRHFEPKDSE